MFPDTYFEFYDLPVAFYIDEALLRERYLEFSREYHPDAYTLADAETKEKVEAITAYNNTAYKTLNDFDARLAYILTIKGLISTDEKAIQQEKIDDFEFLSTMMDFNEALMELEFEPEAEKLKDLHNQLTIMQKEAFEQVAADIKNYNDANENAEILKKVKNFYKKSKYFLRISEKLSTFALL